MKRWIVLLLLIALPIRTVLAVTGIGCAMPSMPEHSTSADAPCSMHDAAEADEGTSSNQICPSCDAACFAALAPAPAAALPVLPAVSPSIFTVDNFDQITQGSLERPPKTR